MKVIAKVNDSIYLAEVSHTELEKVTDKYYGNMKRLEVGATMNLGAGHDFRNEIKSACKQMTDAVKQFERAQKSLFAFAIMAGQLPEPTEPTTE